MLNKKTVLLFSLLLSALLFSSTASSAPEAPENGQWAFSLMETVRLYSKPDRNSKFREVSFNGRWVQAPSARRDDNNNLWYKVKVNGKEGWIFQTGIRLKMGAKSKAASNIYKRCANMRSKIINGSVKGWTKEQNDDGTVYYSSKNALIIIKRNGRNIEDLYFSANNAKFCSDFLGFNAIGMDTNSLRSKLGTPTMRETPPDEPDVNILSYELADRDMTLSFNLRRQKNSDDYKVEFFELYQGKTGDNNNSYDSDSESENNFDNYDSKSENNFNNYDSESENDDDEYTLIN